MDRKLNCVIYSREAEERIVALQKEVDLMKAEESRKLEQEREEHLKKLRDKFPDFETERARILAEEGPKYETMKTKIENEVSVTLFILRAKNSRHKVFYSCEAVS